MTHLEPRLMSYLYYFNVEQDFFECHEYLESLWLDSGRPQILQGLIQAAVCLYHLNNGNVRGAVRMWTRAKPRLQASMPAYETIDLVRFAADIDEVFRQIPDGMTSATVTPAEIQRLKIAPVTIQFTTPDMYEKVVHFAPAPLPEER